MSPSGHIQSQHVTFYVGASKFGIPIIYVKEVQRLLDITPVPRSNQIFQGLANLRGKIVTVIDIVHCFGIVSSSDTSQQKLLILKTNQERRQLGYINSDPIEKNPAAADVVALQVDRVSETVELREENFKPIPVNFDKSFHQLLTGVVEDGTELLFVINLNALLTKVLDYADGR